MAETTKFPRNNEELLELGKGPIVRFPAEEEEYWSLVEESDLRLDYYKNEIIAAMSYESDDHSTITSMVNYLLQGIYLKKEDFKIHNSNRPVCVPVCDNAIFNPDGSVISLPAKHYEYRPGMTAELTPAIVFEVLSKSTKVRDWGEKLPCYKEIETIRHIFYIEMEKIKVHHFEKLQEDQWLESVFEKAEDVITLEDHTVKVRDVYLNTLVKK